MQMNGEFRERQPIGVKNLSAPLTRHRLECFNYFQWFDNNDMKMMREKKGLELRTSVLHERLVNGWGKVWYVTLYLIHAWGLNSMEGHFRHIFHNITIFFFFFTVFWLNKYRLVSIRDLFQKHKKQKTGSVIYKGFPQTKQFWCK